MAITIHDVAKRAGVSPSTVSRVISGNSQISEKTTQNINKVMKEMNFYPNSQARNLAKGNSNNIALVIDANEKASFANMFFNSSVFGIEKIVQENNYNLLITNNNDSGAKKSSVMKLLFESKVDGLILPPSILTTKLIKEINTHKIPFVVLGESSEFGDQISYVDINNKVGSKLAVQHLKDRGYKHIAYLGGCDKEIFSENRILGYQETVGKESAHVYKCESNKEAGMKEALKMLTKKECDSVICNDNILAFCVIKAAKKMGINIPGDLGLVTFDNYPLAEYTDPELTAIVIDTYAQGEEAANFLFNSMKEHSTLKKTLLIPSIISRESTDRDKNNE
ncbi:MAG: LacI family transcriptional regulator [Sphaerochaetaceae bacterium]|nr:LacI family transcriptional regulator [Sphaerochaetaceae bacterium]